MINRALEMIPTIWLAKFTMGLGVLAIMINLAQVVVPPSGAPNVPDSIGHLGLDGILSVAVLALWRKVNEKDKLVMDNYKAMSDSLATNKLLSDEMLKTLRTMQDTLSEEMLRTMKSMQDTLGRMDNVRSVMGPK